MQNLSHPRLSIKWIRIDALDQFVVELDRSIFFPTVRVWPRGTKEMVIAGMQDLRMALGITESPRDRGVVGRGSFSGVVEGSHFGVELDVAASRSV